MIKSLCDWCYREMPESELHKIKIPWYNIDLNKRQRYLTYDTEMELCHECCKRLAYSAFVLKSED